MEFEYDLQKSKTNHEKHGISFENAVTLWEDENLLQIKAKDLDEIRFLVIGKIKTKHWSAIITLRGEKIRIISVRRSRTKEIELYESK